MTTITAKSVKSLRDRTGAGMMDCKKALTEAGGDEEMAIDLLRKWGSAKAAKRAERDTREGTVHVEAGDSGFGMVAVSSETDFVARNDEFLDFAARIARAVEASDLEDGEVVSGDDLLSRDDFAAYSQELVDLRSKIGENIGVHSAVRLQPAADSSTASYVHFGGRIGVLVELTGAADQEDAARDVAMHVAAANPVGVSPDDIPEAEKQRERQVLTEQALEEGKPEAIVEKIVEGRMRKFFEQSSLLLQAFVKDSDVTVEQMLGQKAEGLTVKRFVRFQIGE